MATTPPGDPLSADYLRHGPSYDDDPESSIGQAIDNIEADSEAQASAVSYLPPSE